MYLSRIVLDPRCREVRRDLSDPYELHSTLCRAFSTPERKCPEGEFLWRQEPETTSEGWPQILVQSHSLPAWNCIGVKGWLAKMDPPIDINSRLRLDNLKAGQRYRFRLRANPCVTRQGKRLGLLRNAEQQSWLTKKGGQHGFTLPRFVAFDFAEPTANWTDVLISQEQMHRGKQHTGNPISIFSVLYDGFLMVDEPNKFRVALEGGIGHGKAMGLGLLSVIQIA